MSSLFLILLCCLGALIIHLWFYSDFFAYYLKFFRILIPVKIYKWLLVDEYLNNEDSTLCLIAISNIYTLKDLFQNHF
jgi:hypothetical protein